MNLQLLSIWIEEHKKQVAIGLVIATVVGIILTQISWSSPSSPQPQATADQSEATYYDGEANSPRDDNFNKKPKINKLSFTDVSGYSYDIEYEVGDVDATNDSSEGKPGYVGISKATIPVYSVKIANTTSGKKAPCLVNMSVLPVYAEPVSTELKQLLGGIDTLYSPGWELKKMRLYDTPLSSADFNDGDDGVPSQTYTTMAGLKASLKTECGNGIDNRMDAGATLEYGGIIWSADNSAVVKEDAASRIVELLKKPTGYVVAYSDYTKNIYLATIGEGVKAYGNMNGDAIVQFVKTEDLGVNE